MRQKEGLAVRQKTWWIPAAVLAAGVVFVWPQRHLLTAEGIAALSPGRTAGAAIFLLALYAAKGFSVVLPLSALEAAGGLVFPLPLALAVNAAGVALAQTGPYLLGRRQEDPAALRRRWPRLWALLTPGGRPGRGVFLLRLAGTMPGDVVSFLLGAAGISWRAYLAPGLLGSLPRITSATLLGSALWEAGSPRFWLSLAAGGICTLLSLLLWHWMRKNGGPA